MIDIGIMQGRLLPPFEGRFQAFPATGWQEEFAHARDAGLACIEWIYEEPHEAGNPLGSADGLARMAELSAASGVAVRSICADYYMTRRLVTPAGEADETTVAHLRWLMQRARLLGATYMVLPFVDASSLRSEPERLAAERLLRDLAGEGEAGGVELHLETDLPPERFAALLQAIDHPRVRANFDIGNSASLGYDPTVELTALGPWLGSVHVKDRLLGGGTVPLGTGNADFATCFRLIRASGFRRWLILQAARSTPGDEVAWARGNVAFVRTFVD